MYNYRKKRNKPRILKKEDVDRLWKQNNIMKKQLNEAAQAISGGNLVAFPTETVYGLGANALLPDAVKQCFQ